MLSRKRCMITHTSYNPHSRCAYPALIVGIRINVFLFDSRIVCETVCARLDRSFNAGYTSETRIDFFTTIDYFSAIPVVKKNPGMNREILIVL